MFEPTTLFNRMIFHKKDGNVSSHADFTPFGYTTSYNNNPGIGGTTFSGKFASFRYNKDGRFMSMGIGDSRRMSYFDNDLRSISQHKSF